MALIRTLLSPASMSRSSTCGLLPLVLTWMVAPGCSLADPPGGLDERIVAGQRLALAPLAEGDDRGVVAAEVPVGKSGQLVGGGREAHPVLGRGHLAVALQGDAAEAVGVARRRGRQRALVAAVEGVLRGVAAVLECAVGEVVDEAVAGERARRAAWTAAGRSARPYLAGCHHAKVSVRIAAHSSSPSCSTTAV